MGLIQIRKAERADLSLLCTIGAHCFQDTYAAYNTKEDMDKHLKDHFSHDAILSELLNQDIQFFIAYLDEEPVGFVQLKNGARHESLNKMTSVEIARFYAMPHMKGKGIGSAMMQYCISFARQSGKELIWLGVWVKNTAAIAFYTAMGFSKLDDITFLLGNDLQHDWLMKLDLK